jgi:hypothetical protein
LKDAGTIAEKQEEQSKLIKGLNEQMQALSFNMEKSQIADYILLLQRPKRLIFFNLLSGISRGIGIAIGVTIFTSSAVYILQLIGALNIPIIGDYIADVVKHVTYELERDGIRY